MRILKKVRMLSLEDMEKRRPVDKAKLADAKAYTDKVMADYDAAIGTSEYMPQLAYSGHISRANTREREARLEPICRCDPKQRA
jgi:hypothetical protein